MLVRKIRNKGANLVVTAYGEVLFMPGGELHGWTRRFGNNVQKFAAEAAPTNKRPRWGHYGKPLKASMVSSPARFRQTGSGGARVHIAVGSTAPHAYYVDQGTKSFNAKILPPWQRHSPTLYEHTWKVPEKGQDEEGRGNIDWAEIGTIRVRGQRAQHFMDKGVKRAFQFMGNRAAQVSTDPKVQAAAASFPHGLSEFKGNTPADMFFMTSLLEWRRWRDEAFRGGRLLGRGQVRERTRRELRYIHRIIERRRATEERKALAATKSKIRSQVRRDAIKAGVFTGVDKRETLRKMRAVKDLQERKPTRGPVLSQARRLDKANFTKAMVKKYKGLADPASVEYRAGRWYITIESKDDLGRRIFTEVSAKAKS